MCAFCQSAHTLVRFNLWRWLFFIIIAERSTPIVWLEIVVCSWRSIQQYYCDRFTKYVVIFHLRYQLEDRSVDITFTSFRPSFLYQKNQIWQALPASVDYLYLRSLRSVRARECMYMHVWVRVLSSRIFVSVSFCL